MESVRRSELQLASRGMAERVVIAGLRCCLLVTPCVIWESSDFPFTEETYLEAAS